MLKKKLIYWTLLLGRINDAFSALRGKADVLLFSFGFPTIVQPFSLKVSSLKGTTTHLDHFLSVYHPSLAPFSMPHILLPFLIILAFVSIYGLQELVMDREPWRAAVHTVTKSRTRLSNWTELIPHLDTSIYTLMIPPLSWPHKSCIFLPINPISCSFQYLTFLKSIIPVKHSQ